MDRAWMREQLEAFDNLAARYRQSTRPGDFSGDAQLGDQLYKAEPTIKQILKKLDPALAESVDVGKVAGAATARRQVQRALGILENMDEWAKHLEPDAPVLSADQLHPWVWEPAAPLWAAEAWQDAVLSAARVVNRRLQHLIDRHDIGESELLLQTFDLKEPAPGKPRLRFPGDRSTPTWRAQQEGAKFFGAGIFLAIRNVAAHEEAVAWTEHEALEQLASLSVLCRWIASCDVERVTQ
ncbi:hypothetical protein GCM10022288_15700 [Gryllotalpicola kribbensis]|uniref:Conserved hypothetical protein CHP02391 domain-containing protein n=1 Tax=Gryllotalpicola kribbensis TaxID=993084 RepID=A0ABP8AS31_9MICO